MRGAVLQMLSYVAVKWFKGSCTLNIKKEGGKCADFQTVFGLENIMLVISDFYIKNEKKLLSKVANVCHSGLQRWGF